MKNDKEDKKDVKMSKKQRRNSILEQMKNKKKDKARKVEETAADSDTGSSVGRVEEVVRADQASKSKIAHLQMTVLDRGRGAQPRETEYVIDSGVNKTLLAEKHWQQVKASPNYRKPKLKRNMNY